MNLKIAERIFDIITAVGVTLGSVQLLWTHLEDGWLLLLIALLAFMASGWCYVTGDEWKDPQ